MKSIVIIFILSIASVAAAGDVPVPGTPPAGWAESAEHAAVVRGGIASGLPPEIQAADIRVYSYTAPRDPKRGNGQLIFSVVGVPAGDEAAGAAFVRTRLDELRETTKLMASAGGKVRELAWKEATDDTGRVVDAMLEWAHDDNGTHSLVRAAWVRIAGAPDLISEVRAECVLAADAVEALRPACAEALASMLLPEAAARQPLVPASAGAGEEPPGMTATPPGTPVATKPVVEPTPKNDWRPFYVLGALIVLAGAFLWNRKRREEYDADADTKKDEAEAHEEDEEAK